MARGLLVLVAVVGGGLIGGQAGPAVWFALVDVEVITTPACNDVVQVNVTAMCARPQSLHVVSLATTALCAAAAGVAAWRILPARTLRPSDHGATE